MKINWKAKISGIVVVVCLAGSVARSDSLEWKNGSLIKGKSGALEVAVETPRCSGEVLPPHIHDGAGTACSRLSES